MSEDLIINVPEIRKEIGIRHKAFVESCDLHIDKTIADKKLVVQIIAARLQRILICFKEEGIIDNVSMENDGPYRKIHISKNGFENSIVFLTDGEKIVLKGKNVLLDMDDNHVFYDVCSINYDWKECSLEIIDYIHQLIYSRKKVLETRLNSILTSK